MLKNYLKIACKVLARRKFFTFISLFGIAFTLMVLTLGAALLDVAVAPSAPEVHLDRTLFINHLIMRGSGEKTSQWWSSPGYRLLDRYMRDIPNVELFSMTSQPTETVAFVNNKKLENQIRYTDATYWRILDFEFLEGGPYTQQDIQNGRLVAVINESVRERYFGGQPALGQTVVFNQQPLRVIGVVADVPIHRASAVADIWAPIGAYPNPEFMENLMGGFKGILLTHGRKHFPAIREEFQARLLRVEFPQPDRFDMIVGRLETRWDAHLSHISGVDGSGELEIRHDLPLILGTTALFMLLPVINLISINISRIFERASEIGVRKAFGASSLHLVGQFVVENIVLCLAGGVLALVGAFACAGLINASGLIPNTHFDLNYRVFFYALVLSVFFGVVSGAYPAWKMARIHVVAALRGAVR